MPEQQRAQHHDAAFIVQLVGRRDRQFFQDKSRQPVEGKNVQPRVTGQFPVGEQLAFELERGLFGRQQNQRPARLRLGAAIFPQRGADFGKTAEGLAAAGGTEEKAHLHTGFFAQSRGGAKQFIGAGMHFLPHIFYFLSSGFVYACRLLEKSEFNPKMEKSEIVCH